MKRCTILCLIALFIGHRACQGQNAEVTYSGGSGESNAVNSAGQPVPNGNSVEIGYFTAGFDVAANAGSLSALGTAWHEFGSTNIETFAPFGTPVAGRFRGDSFLGDSTFTGKKIYLWIFETTGNGAPAGDFSNVLEYGLFSSSSTSWVFPDRNASPPGNLQTLSSNQIDQFLFGDGIATSGTPLTPGSLQLANVPEPGAMALLGMGLAFGAASLWRNQRRVAASN